MNFKVLIVCFVVTIGRKVCLGNRMFGFLFWNLSTSRLVNDYSENRLIMIQLRFQIFGIFGVVIPFEVFMKVLILKI